MGLKMVDFKFTKENYKTFDSLVCVGIREVSDHWHRLLSDRRFTVGLSYPCVTHESINAEYMNMTDPYNIYLFDNYASIIGLTHNDLNNGSWVFYPEELLSEKDKFTLRLIYGPE